MKTIIHVHSKYSFDCLTPPEKLVDLAVKNGVDILCITDHDTFQGSIYAKEYAQKRYGSTIKIIIGAEYKTDCGDIIGLNLTKEIESKKAEEVMAAIRQQGGLVLLPHPFVSHKNIDFLAQNADAIEIFNARTSSNDNQSALDLAQKWGKPQYVASDAHFLSDAILCFNHFDIEKNTPFEIAILQAKRTFTTDFSSKKHYFRSQMIGSIKKRNLKLFLYATKNWIF